MMSPTRVLALAFLSSVPAMAKNTPGDLRDLVGARAGQAEGELGRRGYRNVRGEKSDDRSYTYWWNGDARQCVVIVTMNGRYDTITSTTAPDCRQDAGGGKRPDSGGDQSFRPRPSYQSGSYPSREGPSYAADRGRIDVGGNAVELGLVCFGNGERPALASTYGWSWNSRRNRYDYGNRTELTSSQFDASVMIQLRDGGGRISLPKKLIPPINSRGSDGWWDLYDVTTGSDAIAAKYRLNGLNKPSITIDRRSGQISIRGTASYAFRGSCDLIDGQDHHRF